VLERLQLSAPLKRRGAQIALCAVSPSRTVIQECAAPVSDMTSSVQ
jgi:hypothetical protein